MDESGLVIETQIGNQRPLVLADTNIWIREGYFRSKIGVQFLEALADAGGALVLPEVVEVELHAGARRRVEELSHKLTSTRRQLDQLTGVSSHGIATSPRLDVAKPDADDALSELDWRLQIIRPSLTIDVARRAMIRAVAREAPSDDKEQDMRDCMVWEHALQAASSGTLHLVSEDKAFHRGRSLGSELPGAMVRECQERELDIVLHPGLVEQVGSLMEGMTQLARPKSRPRELADPLSELRDYLEEQLYDLAKQRYPNFQIDYLERDSATVYGDEELEVAYDFAWGVSYHGINTAVPFKARAWGTCRIESREAQLADALLASLVLPQPPAREGGPHIVGYYRLSGEAT